MAQHYREPTAFARALAGGLRAYGSSDNVNWKRFTQLAKIARAAHLRNGLARVQLGPDNQFIFPLGDHFWHPVFLGHKYEPPVEWLLRRAATLRYAMIDCGANMGYWPSLVSGKEFGARPIVAIEASRSNFNYLENNAHANGDRFMPLHRAISDVSGKKVRLYGRMHFGRSLVPDWNAGPRDAQFEEVETITIDDIAAQYLSAHKGPVLIKLDVEGVEVAAMNGARKTLEQGALLIYEDHEKQEESPATAHLLGMGDMEIWHLGRDNALVKIEKLDQVQPLKSSGFDFFAYRRGSQWAKLFGEGVH
jgi:FkbM family methyltransferase